MPSTTSKSRFAAATTPAQRAALAKAVDKDRGNGLSGDDLRAKYGAELTGPARRKLLREHGYGARVARSYDGYRDGEPRKGSAHAKFHGANAPVAKAPRKRTRKAKVAAK